MPLGEWSGRGFEWLFDAVPDALLVVGPGGGIVAANRQAAALFGAAEPAALVTRPVEDLMPERFHEQHRRQREEYRRAPRIRPMGSGLTLTARRLDGREFPCEVSLSPLEGPQQLVLAAVRDISERRRAEAELRREKERAEVTLAAIADAVVTTDAGGRVDYLNPVAERLTGWTAAGARGRDLREVFHLERDEEAGGAEVGAGAQFSLVRPDGARVPVEFSRAPIPGPEGHAAGIVVVFRDATEQRRQARLLAHSATHDPLTGLVNRAEFERRLARLLGAGGPSGVHSLCFLDLDRFKLVNDTAGHLAGDELLRQAAARLAARTRGRDTLGRVGGDEFALLLEHCAPAEAVRIAEGLARAMEERPFRVGTREFRVGVSIGVVPVTPGAAVAEALARADLACYQAKRLGRGRVVLWEGSVGSGGGLSRARPAEGAAAWPPEGPERRAPGAAREGRPEVPNASPDPAGDPG
ncbi:MAG TPA: diguanylate cyclase [Gemmatimonadales bacterium]|nr:diguanylate cyclase [Gemmatimonadales bacterium]